MLFASKQLQAAQETLSTICTSLGVEQPEQIAAAIAELQKSPEAGENPFQSIVDSVVALLKVENPEQISEAVTALQATLQTAETLFSGLMTALNVTKPEQLGAAVTKLQADLKAEQAKTTVEAITQTVNGILTKMGMEPVEKVELSQKETGDPAPSPGAGLRGMARATAALAAKLKR